MTTTDDLVQYTGHAHIVDELVDVPLFDLPESLGVDTTKADAAWDRACAAEDQDDEGRRG